jgi:GGDEF domain-containing protein
VNEEIARVERLGGALSCLLVDLEGLAEVEREHGAELAARTLAYAGLVLRGEVRCFDRVGPPGEDRTGGPQERGTPGRELLVVLPGADRARGEIVARRLLGRFRAIKIEARCERRAMRVSIGIAPWREGLSSRDLLAAARAAARRER